MTPSREIEAEARLSERQLFALRWIDANPHHTSAWLQNGKSPRSMDTKLWNQIEISGDRGSIRIDTADWRAIKNMIDPAPMESDSIYELNDAARTALSRAAHPSAGVREGE